MNSILEKLRRSLSEYIDRIQVRVIEKLRIQSGEILKTNRGDYEIVKLEQFKLDELIIKDQKVHYLFSQDGCEISGKILVKAQAYTPNSDKNSYTSHLFEIRFNVTTIKFDFEKEDFSIEEDINIIYTTESDKRFF